MLSRWTSRKRAPNPLDIVSRRENVARRSAADRRSVRARRVADTCRPGAALSRRAARSDRAADLDAHVVVEREHRGRPIGGDDIAAAISVGDRVGVVERQPHREARQRAEREAVARARHALLLLRQQQILRGRAKRRARDGVAGRFVGVEQVRGEREEEFLLRAILIRQPCTPSAGAGDSSRARDSRRRMTMRSQSPISIDDAPPLALFVERTRGSGCRCRVPRARPGAARRHQIVDRARRFAPTDTSARSCGHQPRHARHQAQHRLRRRRRQARVEQVGASDDGTSARSSSMRRIALQKRSSHVAISRFGLVARLATFVDRAVISRPSHAIVTVAPAPSRTPLHGHASRFAASAGTAQLERDVGEQPERRVVGRAIGIKGVAGADCTTQYSTRAARGVGRCRWLLIVAASASGSAMCDREADPRVAAGRIVEQILQRLGIVAQRVDSAVLQPRGQIRLPSASSSGVGRSFGRSIHLTSTSRKRSASARSSSSFSTMSASASTT